MNDLREEYKKETGRQCEYPSEHGTDPDWSYVHWLEQKVCTSYKQLTHVETCRRLSYDIRDGSPNISAIEKAVLYLLEKSLEE